MPLSTTSAFTTFDEELGEIESGICRMGGMVEEQIHDAVISLISRDIELSEKVRARDKTIDQLEFDIDESVVQILAKRQPQSQDLRGVVSVLKIAANLERIGDYAKNIAKRSSVVGDIHQIGSSGNIIKRMSGMVESMMKDVLDAYSARDIVLADDVRVRDEEVDELHNTLFRELLTYMMENPRNITPCMHLLFIAKNVERMGDHVTGIAEQIHYLVSGVLPDDERPKGDVTSLTSHESLIEDAQGTKSQ